MKGHKNTKLLLRTEKASGGIWLFSLTFDGLNLSNAALGLSLGFGERGFSFSGPATWNMLPDDLQRCSDTDVLKKN